MGIGKRIKEARENLGLTQKELGDLLGVTGSAVTNYENETSHPKEPVMYKMFDVLKVDANFLFQDEMKKSSTSAKAEAEDLNTDEQKLLEDYRQLNSDGQQVALDFMDSLTYNPKYKKCDQCKNMDADA